MSSKITFRQIVETHEMRVSTKNSPKPQASVNLPVSAGRQTIAEGETTLGSLFAEMSSIDPDFPLQAIDALENLSKWHGEVSQAVDNIKQLGNTSWNVYFDDSVSDTQAKEMLLHIKTRSKNWYAYAGGVNTLINDLLGQVAITGALSSECVPQDDLKGIKKAVLVSPKYIRFRYDAVKDEYIPLQKTNNSLIAGKAVELNTLTYKYISIGRIGEKPYALPPFLAALTNVGIGKNMMDNLKYVIKKLGMLGFLEVLINGPKPRSGEDDKAYFNRTQSYLNQIIPEIDKGLAKGYVAGFKDVHEFQMHSTNGNVEGARALMDLNDTKMMTGLKQDPLMFGRNFSTTETLGRVILAKMTTQISSYQKIVASFLESLFLLDLQMAGYKVTSLDVEFDTPMIGDKLRDEQTRTTTINNLKLLYSQGIINQQQFASEIGYEKPDQEEPRAVVDPTAPEGDDAPDPKGSKKTDPNAESDATDPKTTESNSAAIARAAASLGAIVPQYPYESGVECGCKNHSFDKGGDVDENLAKFIIQYYDATKMNYTKAVKKMTALIGSALLEMSEGATEQAILDKVIYTLFNGWGTTFSSPQKKIVSQFVSTAYKTFRYDKSVFGDNVEGKKIPKGAFSTIDYRALEYYKNSDSFYLGKFITDDDLNKKITKFIKEKYVANELPIGNSKESLDPFKQEFGDMLNMQDWKINRIITTTVNRMRNTAAVSYMDQADVEEYEIRGVVDRLQCGFCREMQGMTFKVAKTVDHINQLSASQPELIGTDSPFINSVFKKPEDISGLSGEDLQGRNIHVPPFHGHCRDVVVAKL